MNFVQQWAHSEQLHTEDTSELVHVLTQPAVALSMYALLNLAIYACAKKYRKGWLLPGLLIFNFVAGVGCYTVAPAVSVIAITLGISFALVVALGSIVGK